MSELLAKMLHLTSIAVFILMIACLVLPLLFLFYKSRRESLPVFFRNYFSRTSRAGLVLFNLSMALTFFLVCLSLWSTTRAYGWAYIEPNSLSEHSVYVYHGGICYETDSFGSRGRPDRQGQVVPVRVSSYFSFRHNLVPEFNSRFSCTATGHVFPLLYIIIPVSLPLLFHGMMNRRFLFAPVPGVCQACGYDLRGCREGADCPECGHKSAQPLDQVDPCPT